MDWTKQALRVATLSQRSSLSPLQSDSWSRSIQTRFLESAIYRLSKAVALYSSVENEVSTDEIRDDALRRGKKVFFPRLGPVRGLALVEIQSAAELTPGKMGILEPSGEKLLEDSGVIDVLIVVPGVAFDQNGNRLGRGQGWYDRVLRGLGPRATPVGLAYEFQIVHCVPVDHWDEKVRYIVTQERLIDCRNTEQTTVVC
jgi:5-formyltetrahydrofolate cyclo-ligase